LTKSNQFETLAHIDEIESIGAKTKASLIEFHNLIKKYISLKKEETFSISELVATLVGELDLIAIFKQEGTFEAQNRIENIRELISGISEFISSNPHLSLEHYLENIALVTDVDNWDNKNNAVSLLTLHSAKGLEFPVVFISGLEEGLFPLARQLSDEENLEEERRLFYVGATRAEEKLYLSAALNRQRFGENSNGTISRFLNEIDRSLLDIEEAIVSTSSFAGEKERKVRKRIQFKEEIKVKKEFKPGILVKHPTFGKGIIRSVKETAQGKKIDIIFEEVGEKKVFLKYAKLEIL